MYILKDKTTGDTLSAPTSEPNNDCWQVREGIGEWVEVVPSLAEVKAAQLALLRIAAASAYVSGFNSSASGTVLHYDSEEADQTLITGVYARTKEPDWEIKERYPGIAPAGKAPIRARPAADSPDSEKTVQILDANQLKILVDDLDSHLYMVKVKHWQLQAAVEAAETVTAVKEIKWDNEE